MAQTFIMFKPDCFERKLETVLMNEILKHGFKIVQQKEVIVSQEVILKHYAEVIARVPIPDFKDRILKAFVNQKVWVMILTSNKTSTVDDFRELLGKTNPVEANPQSLRGKYGNDSYEKSGQEKRMLNNLIHASDSNENAEKEIALWFN